MINGADDFNRYSTACHAMMDLLSFQNRRLNHRNSGELLATKPIRADSVRDQIVTAGTDGDQVSFHRLMGDLGITHRPVVDMKWIEAAIAIAKATAITIQRQTSLTFGGPFRGSDVFLVGHQSHMSYYNILACMCQ